MSMADKSIPAKRVKILIHNSKESTGSISVEKNGEETELNHKKPVVAEDMADKAWRMMQSMGYKSGKGLGSKEQGRVAPVEESSQRGRRGLGLTDHHLGIEAATVVWTGEDDDPASPDADNEVPWVMNPEVDTPLSIDLLTEWARVGPRKLTLDGETDYCDPDVLRDVLVSKTFFDGLDGRTMLDARTRSNPYEIIKSGIFMNRAAMKMANMDRITDFMFTEMCPKSEILYFGDICAGPGGFTEYLLWRRGLSCRGFGFTLRGNNDFKMADMLMGPVEAFTPHYGVHDDGDIFRGDNLDSFRDYVMSCTNNQGLHMMMADGGFSVAGKENIQEILSKQLYLCQFLCALQNLREGGHFVCKLFDLFTPFSVGLVYLMSLVFKDIAVIKPLTSRPANSERYIVCRSLMKNGGLKADDLEKHLYNINEQMNDLEGTDDDVMQLVPLDVIHGNMTFFRYIYDLNNRYGTNQALALAKIRAFSNDRNLLDKRQADLRTACLSKWKVPDMNRKRFPWPLLRENNRTLQILIGDEERPRMLRKPHKDISRELESLTEERFLKESFVLANHVAIAVAGDDPTLIYSRGGQNLMFWSKEERWMSVQQNMSGPKLSVELPAGTLLWGQMVTEYNPPKGQRKVSTLWILDALLLYGEDVRSLNYLERHAKISSMISVLKDPLRPELSPMRTPELMKLTELQGFMEKLTPLRPKTYQREELMYQFPDDKRFYHPVKTLIIKHVAEPWMIAFSRSSQREYFFHTITKQAVFEKPKDCDANYTKSSTFVIPWRGDHQQAITTEEGMDQDTLLKLVRRKQGQQS